jgi:hypothetical protein
MIRERILKERLSRMTPDEINAEMKQYGRVRSATEVRLEKSQHEQKRIGMLLLANEDGKLLLKTLEDLFYKGDLTGDDPHATYFKLGRRDVVDFLLSLRDNATKEK